MIFAHAEAENRKEQEEMRTARDAEEQARIEKIRQFYYGPKPSNDDGLDLAA